MKKSLVFSLGILLLALVSLAVFSRVKEPAPAPGLHVFTSFYPLAYFTKVIGGDAVSVREVTPPGSEPHDYDPTPRDIADIEGSDLLVLNGGLEPWGEKIRDTLTGSHVSVLEAGEGLISTPQDPHVWLDPVLAGKQAHAISLRLQQIDQVHAALYKANEAKLAARISALDAQFRATFAKCARREIVTSHAAFGYLAERYGLTQESIAGFSPDEEPSPAKLAEITNFARAHGVTTIFFESLASPRLSETIAREVGAATSVLDPIEGVKAEDQAKGVDYFSLMDANRKQLSTALSCNP